MLRCVIAHLGRSGGMLPRATGTRTSLTANGKHSRRAHKYRLGAKQEAASAQKVLDDKAAASPYADAWRTDCSCIIERIPMLHDDPKAWEIAYGKLKDELDADQRRQYPAEFFSGRDEHPDDEEEELPEGAQWFEPASRRTPADESGDRKTNHRELAQRVFLLVKKPGVGDEGYAWRLPQMPRTDPDANLANVARDISEQHVGEGMATFLISNAPIGFHAYEFPPDVQAEQDRFGAKTFFYRFHILGGDAAFDPELVEDFVWVTKEEAAEYVHPDYYAYVSQIL